MIFVIAKIFSMVLYNRVAADIDAKRSREPFGFRPGQGCADAVRSARMVVEK